MKKLLVILMVLAFVSPAMAAEWNFYGSARMAYFYDDRDDDASGKVDVDGNSEDDVDLAYNIHANSRVGAKVKASDTVSGRFEYGHGGSDVAMRLLYGVWNFGPGTLLVGQDYSPIDTFLSGQVIDGDIGLLKEGCTYDGRTAQIKLKFGGFQIAFVEPNVPTAADTDVILPKIELAYDAKMDTFSIGGYGGYQTFTSGPSGADWDVTSWLLGVRAKANFGPAYVKGAMSYGMNMGNFGVLMRNTFAGSQVVGGTTGTDTEDATTWAAAFIVGAKINPNFGLEAGVGYMKNEVDLIGTSGSMEGDAITYYFQAPITLAPGVFVVPEISIFDLGDNETTGSTTVDNGTRITYGAKFQINF